jgi:hypothetical protein
MSALFKPDQPAEPLVETLPLPSFRLLVVLGAVQLIDAYLLRRINEAEDAAAYHLVERLFDRLRLRCSLSVNPLDRRRPLAAPVAFRYACLVGTLGLLIVEI